MDPHSVLWRQQVEDFILTNYDVDDNTVNAMDIFTLFNGHGFRIPFNTINHVFKRKKNIKRPTKAMRVAFDAFKSGFSPLLNFPDMMLKGNEQPTFTEAVLSTFYFWSLSAGYDSNTRKFPIINDGSALMTTVKKHVRDYLDYCKGRYEIDESLFADRNLWIFKDKYVDFILRITPTDEAPIKDTEMFTQYKNGRNTYRTGFE